MTIKSLRKSYDNLLAAFEQAGVKLTESQKQSLDTFMLDLQTKLAETRDRAIEATRKVVEKQNEAEFRKIFESIARKQKMILQKANEIDRKKDLNLVIESVDKYLGKHIEKVLPKKEIVDYKRMQKQEQLLESLKEMLVVGDAEEKISQLRDERDEKLMSENEDLKKQVSKYKRILKEAAEKTDKLSNGYQEIVKRGIIKQKTKNLPIAESRKARKILSKLSLREVEDEKNFKKILESVHEEVVREADQIQEEKNLEEAIADILEKNEVETSEKTGDEEKGNTENIPVRTADKGEEEEPEADEEDAEVKITESMMQNWIEILERITPKN
jgi:hypothetical protein